MRRILSLVLLAAFSLPLIAPLLALGQDADANLPVCCRRNGAHHCMMNMQTLLPDAHRAGMLCPQMPQPTAAAPHLTLAGSLTVPPLVLVPVDTRPPGAGVEIQRCTSRERAHHTRGPPPATFLAA